MAAATRGIASRQRGPALVFVLLLATLLGPERALGRELFSYALVQEDASLVIRGKRVRLYGIYIPATNRTCRGYISPVRCAQRAALALELRIQGFVHCEERGFYDDGSMSGLCRVDRTHFSEGEDLSAYLITRGWALALPDAPFEYHALEKIARRKGLGVWGFPADVIR